MTNYINLHNINIYNICSRYEKGRTPLHIACEYKDKSTLFVLLNILSEKLEKEKINGFNLKDIRGRTALHTACEYSSPDMVKKLLDVLRVKLGEEGINSFNEKDQEGKTPLHIACENDKKLTVSMLLAQEDVNNQIRDNNGNNILHLSLRKGGCGSTAITILSKSLIDINAENDDGDTALHIACGHMWKNKNNPKKIIKRLLKEEDIDVNKTNKYGETPLKISCLNLIKANIVALVNDSRTDINDVSENGSALHFVCKSFENNAYRNIKEAEEVVKLLIKAKIDTGLRDKDGRTAFEFASEVIKHSNLIKILYDCIKGSKHVPISLLGKRPYDYIDSDLTKNQHPTKKQKTSYFDENDMEQKGDGFLNSLLNIHDDEVDVLLGNLSAVISES